MNKHKLNVVVSRTPTIIGALIRITLGGHFNHCAIALDDDYSILYSFSRKYRHFWFTGCYCTEDLSCYTDYVSYSIEINEEEYEKICSKLKYLDERICVYNYISAMLIPFHRHIDFKRSYICSTFVAELLDYLSSVDLEKEPGTYRPIEIKMLLDEQVLKAKVS